MYNLGALLQHLYTYAMILYTLYYFYSLQNLNKPCVHMNPAAFLSSKCIKHMLGAVPNLIGFTYRDNVNENMYRTQCLVHPI